MSDRPDAMERADAVSRETPPPAPTALDFVMQPGAAMSAIGDRLRFDHRGNNPDNCPDPECTVCGFLDCPKGDPLHYHHDGCPSCAKEDSNA